MFQQLKDLLKMKNDTDRPTKRSYIILIGLIGLLFLIVSNIFSSDTNQNEPTELEQEEVFLDKNEDGDSVSEEEAASEIRQQMQKDLSKAIETIEGVSNVQVMLQLEASSLKVYEKNTITGHQRTSETDQNGGTREVEDETIENQTVILRKNNSEKPLLIQEKNPSVRGVLIIAEGVDNLQIKQMVVESVSRLLDVSTHRIAVMPKDEEE
ncbi:stage III sporulation protein AG [Tenuibacillus multivorans]|uniref:Stage III sporulation protein AG n=1 Tax=Tenuibacillus multivorans TaxID=237069 RepID=A0A1G9Z831_9BACI|nr:stage III sporulation protein AG [Tenuibacillus multivorans]GEL77366.1 stage III sporulation protein AG [Tenuibacillus multivorans]SDN17285.1 stage III sporulation protein AG [Tenuibacillus multivorans]